MDGIMNAACAPVDDNNAVIATCEGLDGGFVTSIKVTSFEDTGCATDKINKKIGTDGVTDMTIGKCVPHPWFPGQYTKFEINERKYMSVWLQILLWGFCCPIMTCYMLCCFKQE